MSRKLEKTAKQCISVKISVPGTIPLEIPLYPKLYHFYQLQDAVWFSAHKINQGYRVQIEYSGDPETFYDPSLVDFCREETDNG